MRGGNILHLQKILGHQSVQMTQRYAHLAPDFVEEARRVLNGAGGQMVTLRSRSADGGEKA